MNERSEHDYGEASLSMRLRRCKNHNLTDLEERLRGFEARIAALEHAIPEARDR